MQELQTFTFECFRPHELDTTTLAYWPFRVLDPPRVEAVPLKLWWSKATRQYENEGQASATDDLFGCAELEGALQLLAPVQLVEQWSPLPRFGEVLGAPDILHVTSVSPVAAFACWRIPHPRAAASFETDRQRKAWTKRVDELVRAASGTRPFAIVAFPGFDYENRNLSSPARRAFRAAGLPFDNRAP